MRGEERVWRWGREHKDGKDGSLQEQMDCQLYGHSKESKLHVHDLGYRLLAYQMDTPIGGHPSMHLCS